MLLDAARERIKTEAALFRVETGWAEGGRDDITQLNRKYALNLRRRWSLLRQGVVPKVTD
jgi:hypothetical protein